MPSNEGTARHHRKHPAPAEQAPRFRPPGKENRTPMNTDRFNERTQEVLNAAHRLASKFGHQQMDVEHVLLALLDQERGQAGSLLTRAGVATEALKIKVQRELEKLPRVSGGGSDQVS